MGKNKFYPGIDYFRCAAAFLVIAIHTSPLVLFGETGDFIFTRIISRAAVPFFFMTSGFFLITRYACNTEKLRKFVKKTAAIYLTAMLVYVPLNIYSGYFKMEFFLPNLIKDIVFDGTFYHLWYLPASITGACIGWYLVRRLDYKKAFGAAFILYVIGLFGDSYYGLSEKIPVLKSFYASLFLVSDYTRNGIFFAPLFFVLGGFIAENCRKLSGRARKKSVCGFTICFVCMFGEALLLHYFQLQRHDSMYLFLPLCMYFLFYMLLQVKGKKCENLRNVSLCIYIIHPWIIVAVRLFGKLFHLQNILIDNSVVHYVIVCLASLAFSMIGTALWKKYKPAGENGRNEEKRAYVEINLENLEHNARVLKGAMPTKCSLMAVVKAEAYGHGAFEISTHLNKMGVEAFAVATIDEGIQLRKYGIRGEILILGYTDIYRAAELKKYDLMQTLIDFDYASALNRRKTGVKAHIKIDTGMHRLGVEGKDVEKIEKIFSMKYIKVCGMYTHLCCADSLKPEDAAFTREQINRFYKVAADLEKDGITIPKIHIQSSYGLLNYPELACDYVRAGIALYGVLSSPEDTTVLKLNLRPVLSLKTRVVLIRKILKGESVGYGRKFTAERDSVIAILPIGYGDGFPRNLSCKKGMVSINGKYAPIAGMVCMDQMAVDITGIEDVAVGDAATLICGQGNNELMAPYVAARSNSISNELLCRIGERCR